MTGIYLPPNVGRRTFYFDDKFANHEQLLLTIAEDSLSCDVGRFLLNLAKSHDPYVFELFGSDWQKEDVGVILTKVGHALRPSDAPANQDPDDDFLGPSFSKMGLDLLRRWMPNAILQELPIENLSESLLGQRLQLDLGM